MLVASFGGYSDAVYDRLKNVLEKGFELSWLTFVYHENTFTVHSDVKLSLKEMSNLQAIITATLDFYEK